MRRAPALVLASALGLTGCTLDPPYHQPVPDIPPAWPSGDAYPTSKTADGPTLSYRDVFADPHLQAVITQALANAQDLQIALANVELARAQWRNQRNDLFPEVDASLSGAGSRVLADSGRGTVTSRVYEAAISLNSFELDLFGRLRSLTRAARDQYLASDAAARAARLTLVGSVAQAYLLLASDRSLLAIAVDTEASAERTVVLTRAKLEGGVSPRTDLAQAETILQQARADRALLRTVVAQDRNALELLVGAPVADSDLPEAIEAVDSMLVEVPAGLDTRILRSRPDVRAAEFSLKSTHAEIGAARAATYFPTISLASLVGLASPQLSRLFSGSTTYQNAASITQPLYNPNTGAFDLPEAKADRDVAFAQYQKTIQTAFREVADALARRGTIAEQLDAQEALVAAADDAYRLGLARYQAGVDPYLDTLDAQRTLYAARQGLVAVRLARAANLASLYQTLGADPLLDVPAGPVSRR